KPIIAAAVGNRCPRNEHVGFDFQLLEQTSEGFWFVPQTVKRHDPGERFTAIGASGGEMQEGQGRSIAAAAGCSCGGGYAGWSRRWGRAFARSFCFVRRCGSCLRRA